MCDEMPEVMDTDVLAIAGAMRAQDAEDLGAGHPLPEPETYRMWARMTLTSARQLGYRVAAPVPG